MMDPNHIRLVHTGTMVTTRCNLRCKLCITGTPDLAKNGEMYSLEHLIKTYDRYFELVEYVGKFCLGGGEPLLRKDLPDLVEHLMTHEQKFSVLEIITNGTLIPSEDLLETLKRHQNKVTVLVDKYGEHSPCADRAGEMLTEWGIHNRVRTYFGEDCHCGGWVDLGDFSLKHPDKESQIALFQKCAYYTKTTKIGVCACDGLLYTCGRAYSSLRAGLITKQDGFVDLFDPSKSIAQLRQEFVELLAIECPPACAYCNGMCEDSKRFIPAEQLPVQ